MEQVGTGWTGTGYIVDIEPVPGTGTGFQCGCIICLWDRGQVSFDLSLFQWDRFGTGIVPVPCACTTWYRYFACTKWYRHSACISLWKSGTFSQVYGVSLSKPQRVPNRISEIPKGSKSNFGNLGKDRWYKQMGQVWTGSSTWDRWDREKGVGLRIGWDRMEMGQGGLQIRWDRVGQWTGLCPDEPVHLSQSGTTRPWNFHVRTYSSKSWNKDV